MEEEVVMMMEKKRSERQEEKQEESGAEEVREGRSGGSTRPWVSDVGRDQMPCETVQGSEVRNRGMGCSTEL